MKTDSLFYRLFQTLPQLLFDLIAQPTRDGAQYHFASVELKQTAFRLDGLFLPPAAQPDWPLFFVEVQFQRDPDLYSRVFAEAFLYLRQQRPIPGRLSWCIQRGHLIRGHTPITTCYCRAPT
jgi:predicted transposase/invertase (TIGR01784 family)